MEEFDQFIIDCNLTELPLSNRQFTWIKSRDSPMMELQDRLFINDEIEEKFPIYKVVGLPLMFSDHCPHHPFL